MMRSFSRSIAAIVAMLVFFAGADRSAAQPPPAPAAAECPSLDRKCVQQKWDALRATAVTELQRQASQEKPQQEPDPDLIARVRKGREEATRQTSMVAAVDAVEADDSTTAATVRRLAGAIKTNPEGTEAGVVIAPFALAGSETLPGLEVTFAALKDDFTRTGLSYTFDGTPKLPDIWESPPTCPVEPRIEKLDVPKDFYFSVCTNVVMKLPERLDASSGLPGDQIERYKNRVRQARLACGFPDPEPGPSGSTSSVATLAEAVNIVRRVVGTTNEVAARAPGVIPQEVALIALSPALKAPPDGWGPPSATSCYTDEFVRGYFKQLYWTNRTWKFAGSISFEFFPRKFGFSPDDSDLPKGDVKSGEARIDFSTARAGTEFSAGLGFGRSKETLTDELRGFVGPSASIAHAFSLLPGTPLTKDGELNVTNGEIPPRLVVGLSTAIQIAVNKRESQETRFNSVKIQPHVDFLINETLSFRLGIPVRAEIAVRKKVDATAETPTSPAKPEVPEKRALQWTVPVALVAVIKL
jgi:hypothetical protein